MRIIAFDLDETLGRFLDLSIIWNDANNQMYNLDQETFNYYCDLFPEFFRPNMLEILDYLAINKQRGDKIVIYTNNNGLKSWTLHIKKYIEHKLQKKIFDNVVCAYKVNGKIVEPKRTSYEKIYSDLLRCVGAPHGTTVCFVDDRIHPLMMNNYVKYIHVKPYHNRLNKEDVLNTIANTGLPYYDFELSRNSINQCNNYNKTPQEEYIDEQVTEEMFLHLSEFLLRKDGF